MVFNATFNNISTISWRSVVLVEETGVPGERYRPVASLLLKDSVYLTPPKLWDHLLYFEVSYSNPAQGEVHSKQHYVINFVSNVLWVFRLPPSIKLNAMIQLQYC